MTITQCIAHTCGVNCCIGMWVWLYGEVGVVLVAGGFTAKGSNNTPTIYSHVHFDTYKMNSLIQHRKYNTSCKLKILFLILRCIIFVDLRIFTIILPRKFHGQPNHKFVFVVNIWDSMFLNSITTALFSYIFNKHFYASFCRLRRSVLLQ